MRQIVNETKAIQNPCAHTNNGRHDNDIFKFFISQSV